jgi:hypothetical protein
MATLVASNATKVAMVVPTGCDVRRVAGWDQPVRTKLRDVEILFTTLLVLAGVAITWFAFYVVYRLYADQR